MIIGVSGKIGSGKDTIGNIILYLTDTSISARSSESISYTSKIMSYNEYSKGSRTPCSNKSWQIKKFAHNLKKICSILTGIPVKDFEKQEVKDRELGGEWSFKHNNWEKESLLEEYAKHEGLTLEEYLLRGNHELIGIMGDEKLYRNTYLDTRITVRQLLQKVGTEAMRDCVHEDIWVNSLFSEYIPIVYYMCDKCGNENITKLLQISSRFKSQGYNDDEYACPYCKGKEEEGDITKVINDKVCNWVITDLRFPNELEAIKKRDGITIRVKRAKFIAKEDWDNNLRSQGRVNEVVKEHPSESSLDGAQFDYYIYNNGTIEELVEKVKEILIKEKII